ncbi:MAG: hypothetical protein LBU83_07630 [Bacteroidales bacterium]|jgi:hypothetical protein|nr:hypothetical protein [Bacteroidales bacterium]
MKLNQMQKLYFRIFSLIEQNGVHNSLSACGKGGSACGKGAAPQPNEN